MQRAEFRRRVVRIVALPLVLTTVLASVSLAQAEYLVTVNEWVDHTDHVIADANQTLRLLVDMETGVRGYLLTGRPEFLEPYETAASEIEGRLRGLRDRVLDNPSQVVRIDAVRERERLWSDYARGLVASGPGGEAAGGYEVHVQGKALMDSLRAAVMDFVGVEDRLRTERVVRARTASWVVAGGSGALVLLAGVFLAFYSRRALVDVSSSYGRVLAERERAEAELRRLNEELEARVRRRTLELSEAVGELEAFSYSVSHDLRAPLRGISGFTRVLEEDYAARLDDEGREFLVRIRAASRKMERLIDDLLQFSRVGRGDLARTRVDLSALVRGIESELRAREPMRQVETSVEPELLVQADAPLMRIALMNLLENAWKFTRNQPVARIGFGAEQVDGERAFYVRDNGAGFDMAYADKLFAPFQRLHRDTEFEGTGIGLATVRRIVARHGGRVWAHSAPGEGTTFFFTMGEP